jgi:hypothetical protein
MKGQLQHGSIALCALAVFACVGGCDTPQTLVVIDNDYPPSSSPMVIFQAFWQAVSFTAPVAPAASSDPQSTVAASPNTAWVVLAPGFDPTSSTPPASFIVLESLAGFEVHLDDTLHIPVDDTTFVGNCAAGSVLSQSEADFITQRVFASVFAGSSYDAATCTTTPVP